MVLEMRMENIAKDWKELWGERMSECERANVKGDAQHMGALKTNGSSKQAQRSNEMKPA